MPLERPTLAELRDAALADIEAALPGADARLRRSVLDVDAAVRAAGLHGLYGYVDWWSGQLLADKAEVEHLERHAGIWGIARKPASYAEGTVTFSGTTGTNIPAGTQLKRADGMQYETTVDGVVAAGAIDVALIAREAGAGGNASAGTKLALISPISGITSQAVAAGDFTDGADAESDTSLRVRLIDRIQAPPHGGAAFDYPTWALERPGVTRAWVYPQELGLGTVTVRFMMDDTYPDGIPLAGDVATLQAALDAARPVTADLTVVAPVPVPYDMTITGLSPATPAVRAAIEAEITDLVQREAIPGGTILISHAREACSIAAGESDHAVTFPAGDKPHATGEIAVPGTITFA